MTWPQEQAMWRIHSATYPPDGFNPSPVSEGRFRPFPAAARGGRVVPTMYVADSLPAAVSETLFHDLDPNEEDQVILRARLYPKVRSIVAPVRDLSLVDLRGNGLRRLRLRPEQLILTPPDTYPQTALWGRAFFRCPAKPDGIAWSSRLHPGGTAAILFEPRVRELEVDLDEVTALWQSVGLEEVLAAAEEARVTILM
jgi:RES domain-containing protein